MTGEVIRNGGGKSLFSYVPSFLGANLVPSLLLVNRCGRE